MNNIIDLIIKKSPHLNWLSSNTEFLTLHGSRAYNTHTHTSDYDYKGICICPKKYYLGFQDNFEQAELKEPDSVVYEIKKFFNLASQCNPNIIEVLFCDEKDYIFVTDIGQEILENKNIFLSKKIKHTFSGYAVSQLNRIKSHKKYLLNPPKFKPTRKDFGLSESLSKEDQLALYSDNYHHINDLLNKEKKYYDAKKHWDQYENWKINRNPKRAFYEEKFGYDTKHAYHLVRLMRMCKEILLTGKVIVKRPDREELLEIRNGYWSYERLIEFAENEEKQINKIYNSSNVLSEKPDLTKINNLCIKLIEKKLNM